MFKTKGNEYSTCYAYNNAPNEDQLSKMVSLIETISTLHSKVLICRLNLISPKDDHVSLQYLIKQLKRKYKSDFYGYAWTCEVSKKRNEHYHLLVMLNGSKYRDDVTHMDDALHKWTLKTGMYGWVSVYDSEQGPTKVGGILERGDTLRLKDVIYGCSYMCKTSQKPDSKSRWFNLTQLNPLLEKLKSKREKLSLAIDNTQRIAKAA